MECFLKYFATSMSFWVILQVADHYVKMKPRRITLWIMSDNL